MKRDAKGILRQTASEYAEELQRWGRHNAEQIRKAVSYALDRGTILPDDAEAETEAGSHRRNNDSHPR